jgi:hypothetical protein
MVGHLVGRKNSTAIVLYLFLYWGSVIMVVVRLEGRVYFREARSACQLAGRKQKDDEVVRMDFDLLDWVDLPWEWEVYIPRMV